MKKVLSVQDLSCVGKCSLTVALPVLSAMGCACSVLPTAVLSTHTAFPAPYVRSMTQEIAPVCDHWQAVGMTFDVISVGYLSDPAQAEAVEQLFEKFPAFTVLDPAMGDGGKLYSGLEEQHVAAMKRLCAKADVLLPNVTEACLLTGIPYRQTADISYYRQLLDALKTLAPAVVLTGVTAEAGKTGFLTQDGFLYQADKLPGHYHGTGDLFTAVLTGGVAKGKSLHTAAVLAAKFVEKVLQNTKKETPFGVEFESQLPWLWENLQ